MKHTTWGMILVATAAAALPLYGDTLVLRNGKEINGTFLGATPRQIEFLPSSGQSTKIAIESVETVNFSAPVVVAPPAPARQGPRKPITVPVGTTFRVRTIDFIDVDSTQ